jgi:Tol biopolymer transport system component
MRCTGVVATGLLLVACSTEPNPDYCDETRPCAVGTCDLDTNRCVQVADARTDAEPGSVDANLQCESAGGRLAWRSPRDGDDEIFMVYADGSDLVQLTNNTATDSGPVWSPDGARLAWTQGPNSSEADIFVMRPDGSGVVNLTNTPDVRNYLSSWSPDGSEIAFASNRDGNYEIYVVPSTGGLARNLTNSAGDDLNPAWSPDGVSIAFDSDRDGGNPEIYVMASDGTAPTRVTNEPGNDTQPSWAPDGSKLVFASSRPNVSVLNVWTMNPNGSGLANLTQYEFEEGTAGNGPAWSPDGATIVFTHKPTGGTTTSDIWSVPGSGGGLTRLTTADDDDRSVVWSPDGTRLAFRSSRDGNAEIYTMRADGTEQQNISQDAAFDEFVSWGRCH